MQNANWGGRFCTMVVLPKDGRTKSGGQTTRCPHYCYYIPGLRVFSSCEDIAKERNMDCRERGSHARGVYPTQYTSRMETARVKEEVGVVTRIIVKE